MEKYLIFIKHHLRSLWRLIEWINGVLFSLLYRKKIEYILNQVFDESRVPPFVYKKIDSNDIIRLHYLLKEQELEDLVYFNPHGFDIKTLNKQLNNWAFLMMGAFDGEKLVGYFFLRFFMNKKCFVGRLIDKSYRGKGIGVVMNNIMYETAWRMGFRCLSTISKNNEPIMRAHAKNKTMVVLKELQNDYILIEFKREGNVPETKF